MHIFGDIPLIKPQNDTWTLAVILFQILYWGLGGGGGDYCLNFWWETTSHEILS